MVKMTKYDLCVCVMCVSVCLSLQPKGSGKGASAISSAKDGVPASSSKKTEEGELFLSPCHSSSPVSLLSLSYTISSPSHPSSPLCPLSLFSFPHQPLILGLPFSLSLSLSLSLVLPPLTLSSLLSPSPPLFPSLVSFFTFSS